MLHLTLSIQRVGGKSRVGFSTKKPAGFILKPSQFNMNSFEHRYCVNIMNNEDAKRRGRKRGTNAIHRHHGKILKPRDLIALISKKQR
jgi:hypothetical protein